MTLPAWVEAMPSLLLVPLSAIGIYVVVIVLVRLNGLRSFATMSAFDFAMTVATGSLIATTLLSGRPSLIEGALGAVTLFAMQRLVSWLRGMSGARHVIDNAPRLLVRDGAIHEDNLKRCRVTHSDLYAHLRQHGIARLDHAALVVFETTGQVSVVRQGDGAPDEALLREVQG